MKSVIKLSTICLPLLFTGCFATQPTTFYLLKAMDAKPYRNNEIPAVNLSVYIKPVTFPDYLDRPQMVFRESDYKLQLSEYHRWAEPLQDNFSKVLVENINARISPGRVITYAELSRTKVNFQLDIEVQRFDVNANDQAILIVNWTLLTGPDGKSLLPQNNQYSVPLTDSSYEARVAAQSKAVAEFTDQVVDILWANFLIETPH